MGLGEFIKYTRIKKNLSLGDVAHKSGLARSYIYRLEEGDYKSPAVMTLIRIAKGLCLSHETLFSIAGVSVKTSSLPAPDIYLRTKLKLSEEAIAKVIDYINLIKSKYANTKK